MSEQSDSFPVIYHQLIQALNLPSSCDLNDEGRSTIVDGNNVEITVQYIEKLGEMVVFSVIDDLEDNPHRTEILEKMFKADFFWAATKGFTIALEKDGWRAVLMGRERDGYFTGIEHLYAYLVNCGKLVWEWRQLIEEADLPDVPDAPEKPSPYGANEIEGKLGRELFPGNEVREDDAHDFRIRP